MLPPTPLIPCENRCCKKASLLCWKLYKVPTPLRLKMEPGEIIMTMKSKIQAVVVDIMIGIGIGIWIGTVTETKTKPIEY
jgi:hypothetical protein